jgi:hypothetical protein
MCQVWYNCVFEYIVCLKNPRVGKFTLLSTGLAQRPAPSEALPSQRYFRASQLLVNTNKRARHIVDRALDLRSIPIVDETGRY